MMLSIYVMVSVKRKSRWQLPAVVQAAKVLPSKQSSAGEWEQF